VGRAKRASTRTTTTTVLEEERAPAREKPVEHPVDRLFERVAPAPASLPEAATKREVPAAVASGAVGLRTARIADVTAAGVQILLRGQRTPLTAQLGEGVERELVMLAKRNRDVVLVELEPGADPVVVGVVQTRFPREVLIKADKVQIEGEREVLLRSGRAAIRLREDGDVELVGSRILAMSRGLFRIVGRILRLN
jgi:hypothetical protein